MPGARRATVCERLAPARTSCDASAATAASTRITVDTGNATWAANATCSAKL